MTSLDSNVPHLINDAARVYKGGSWKDREYWLDPAQRRYYPEDTWLPTISVLDVQCLELDLNHLQKRKRKTN